MKKYIFLIVSLLFLIVLSSGCTSNASNKTYSANGVSFSYPGNWNEQNTSDLQSQIGNGNTVLAYVGENNVTQFAVQKINIGSNQRLTTLSEWASSINSTTKNNGYTYVSEKSTTIDGVNAIQITLKSGNSYLTADYFIKNGNGYGTLYSANNNDQTNLDMILNSLKIT